VQRLDGRPVTANDRLRLPYVEWVIAGTLRLYPTSWVIAREASAASSIGPYRIEPGTVVLMSQWVLHRDGRFFDEPHRLHPSARWTTWPGGCRGSRTSRSAADHASASVTRSHRWRWSRYWRRSSARFG